MRKGYFFTLDALLALFILFIGLMLMSNVYTNTQPRQQISYFSEDVISLLSDTKVTDLNNTLLAELIANGTISDLENSILEQIGIFWVTNKTDLATKLAKNISHAMIPDRYGFAFVVGGDTVYAEPKNRKDELATYKSMITGIEKARPIKGTAARIYLSQVSHTLTTNYAFLGGFVGQGNLTKYILDVPADANITEIYLEVDAGNNFSLFINDLLCDNFSISGANMSSDAWDITYCNASIIKGSDNNFTFVFEGAVNTSFIGGGFIKLSFFTKDIYLKNTSSHRYHFPGIYGIVNLYDGIDVPGSLNNMHIYLHYLANHSNSSNNTFYLTIGNMTVYRDNYSNDTMSITLNNTFLSSQLDYSAISNQTIPIRVGFENISFEYFVTDKGNGDVIAITDVSGSMEWEFDSSSNGEERFCKDTELKDQDSMRLAVAKCILKDFSHNILYNITGNRVGLTTYYSQVRDMLGLGTNLTDIINEVNSYYADGGTCVSCGVVSAANLLLANDAVDLISKEWFYTNSYQTADPPGWTAVSYDDSAWLSGFQKFGFGTSSDYYTGNVWNADFWDHPNDVPAPADFTSGIYYTANSFGLISADIVTYPLSNMHFDGPSISSWIESGTVNLSTSSDAYIDAFSNAGFETGDFTNWNWQQNSYRTNSGGNCQLDRYANDGSRIVNGNIGDWELLDGSYTGGGGDQVNSLDGFDTGANDGYTGMLKSAEFNVPANAINLTFMYHSDYRSADSGQCDDPGGNSGYRWRDTDSETFNTWGEGCMFGVFEEEGAAGPAADDLIFERHAGRDGSSSGCTSGGNPFCNAQTASFDVTPYIGDTLYVTGECIGYGGWDDSLFQLDSVKFYTANSNPYGLSSFVFIDSDTASFGSLIQNFSSPSASPNSAEFRINHSINYSFFDGTATVFCNLTHPGALNGQTIWQEFWDSAVPATLPPQGPVEKTTDITAFITSDSFDYKIECGAYVTTGGGRTVVALDDFVISINHTFTGDDGWDWQGGTFGFDNDTIFFPGASGDIELVFDSSVSDDASGAWGIQVQITQDMINAMNSAGGGAWLSFNYRWDAADDGSAGSFESEDQIWIKGYFESPASGQHYLGSEQSNAGGDATIEIWTADDPDTEGEGRYTQDISSWIDNGPDYYYLAFGGKILRSQTTEFGAVSFDNIQIAFTNTSGNTFYRNKFFINDIGDVNNPMQLTITTDSGADVYLNGAVLDSYVGADSNRNIAIVPSDFSRGENVLAIKLKNSDNLGELSVAMNANLTGRQKAMVIMSDGESNSCVGDYGTGTDGSCNQCGGSGCCPGSDGVIDEPCPSIAALAGCSDRLAKEQVVNLSCYFNRANNISIYSVAFGDVAQCGKITLNLSALCDPDYIPTEPHYFESDNPEGLASIYGQIANDLRLAFSIKKSQIISFQGSYEQSFLYPDSYVYLNYSPIVQSMVHGEVPLFFQSPDFNGCTYGINIPQQIRILDSYLLSYSAEHWTDFVSVNNSMGHFIAYNLTRFSTNYANLGDPFPIPIPGSYFTSGEVNTITVRAGDNPLNSTNCSTNTTLLYTGLLNMINYSLPYSTVHPNATGCNWTIEHDMGYNFSILVPADYLGTSICEFTNNTHNSSGFDIDDSYNWAMFNFLNHMDYNNDGRVFINLDEEDFIVNSRVVRDVPYLWGPTIAEVRVWQ